MTDIWLSFSRLQEWKNFLDIALVTILFYGLLRLFRGTQAVQLLRGIFLIGVVIMATQMLELTAFNWLLRTTETMLLVAIPIIFQPELRRALERVGRSAPLFTRRNNNTTTQRLISNIVKSVEKLSESRHGALIVFEGNSGLAELITSGIVLEAELTWELVVTIFNPNTALHDGAVVIREQLIAAAGCVLPLTRREVSDSQLGTRHRAALGISEESDALTIVVSEETGNISVTRNGRMLQLDSNRLHILLSNFYSS